MDDQEFSSPALSDGFLENTSNGAVESKKSRKRRGRVGVGEAEAGASRFDGLIKNQGDAREPPCVENDLIESKEASVPPREGKARRRGGQPGNTNALKHGLYVHHRAIRNTTPVEKADLYDLTDHIQHMKDYLVHLYEIGMKSTELEEINNTARSLAVGYIALGRLIHIHDANSSISLPDDLLGVDFNADDYRPNLYQDPSLAEIVSKLKKLIP
jgi:YD repeat-containing protein